MPPKIGLVVSTRRATLAELDSVYGLEDLENLIEVILVDNHNAKIAARRRRRETK